MTTKQGEWPDLSVVIPVFNRRNELPACVASVREQAVGADACIIVVDDASSDGSADVAEGLGCTVVRLTINGGSGRARDAGLELVQTDWVSFLDSDDAWHPNLVSTLWPHTSRHVLISGGGLLSVGGRIISVLGPTDSSGQLLKSPADILRPANPIVTSATLVRTEVVRAVGGFHAGLRYSEDLDLWLRVLERGTGWCDATPVVTYVRGVGSKSQEAHGGVEKAREQIISAYTGRSWWSSATAEGYLGGMYFEGFRSALRGGQRRQAVAHLGRTFRSPRRVLGAAMSIFRNRKLRRRIPEF